MAHDVHNQHSDDCRTVWRRWAGFLDQELSAEESARVQKHLDICGHCREFVETQTSFNRLMRKSLAAESQTLPENLRVRVLSLLERKSMGQLSEEDEQANRAGQGHGGAHAHAHDHGEPGHTHDHSHPHTHSHGQSPAARAAIAVLGVGLALALFMFFAQRGKNDVLSERVAALEAQARDAKARDAELAGVQKLLQQSKGDRVALELERDEARKQAEQWRHKYDESVLMAEKLQQALSALVAASAAVMAREDAMKPVAELESKWTAMFPQIGAMPHKSGDMDPRLWDVTPIEGEDVLWVVFSRKGDPEVQFTLMTFTEAYLKRHFDGLSGMCETVKDGKTVLAWPNAKDSKVYHALVSTADLKTAREQLQALR